MLMRKLTKGKAIRIMEAAATVFANPSSGKDIHKFLKKKPKSEVIREYRAMLRSAC